MANDTDPYTYHPELRGKIKDPLTSFFRDFDVKKVVAENPELASVADRFFTAAERDVSRVKILDEHRDDDLWILAYGSLMWDPAFEFSEVLRISVPDYQRKFILKDSLGGRGTEEAPGVVAALDDGTGCEGLVFRIPRGKIEVETEILWRREMVTEGYVPKFVTGIIDEEPLTALTFVADYAAEHIHPDLSHREQVICCATGAGLLGTSHEYLKNIVEQFAVLGVVDDYCTQLLHDVEQYLQDHPKAESDLLG